MSTLEAKFSLATSLALDWPCDARLVDKFLLDYLSIVLDLALGWLAVPTLLSALLKAWINYEGSLWFCLMILVLPLSMTFGWFL